MPISENFHTIIYCEFPRRAEYKYILTTFSKENYKKIGQFIVFGSDAKNYKISSSISKDLIISTRNFYTPQAEPVYETNVAYYYIKEKLSKYKIKPDGSFALIYNGGMEKHLAKEDKDSIFIYPVEPPE